MQPITERGAKNAQWGKGSLLNKQCWENWTAVCKRMKMDSYLKPMEQNNRIQRNWIPILNQWNREFQLSMEFSRPEYWSGQPFPSPNPGIELESPALQADSLPTELSWKPFFAQQKFFSLIESYLFIFAFVALLLVSSRKVIAKNNLKELSSRNFMV